MSVGWLAPAERGQKWKGTNQGVPVSSEQSILHKKRFFVTDTINWDSHKEQGQNYYNHSIWLDDKFYSISFSDIDRLTNYNELIQMAKTKRIMKTTYKNIKTRPNSKY